MTNNGAKFTYWLSTEKLTVRVATNEEGRLVETAPVVRRFKGQHIDNLRSWLKTFPGYQEQRL